MNGVYNIFLDQLFTGQIDLATAPITAMLMTPAYSFVAQRNYVADIVANEVSGSGYARILLTNPTITRSDFLSNITYSADNATWAFIDVGLVSAIVLFNQVTSDADSTLVGYFNISPPHVTNDGILSAKWNNTGIFTISLGS